jgi:hypothetical protein
MIDGSFGPLDSRGTIATERVRCACCRTCWADPRFPGRCVYGGPFVVVQVAE